MKRTFRILLKALLGFLILVVLLISVFLYRVTYGFPIYEDQPIPIDLPESELNILVYSKTNGFVHKQAISAAIRSLDSMANVKNWSVIHTKSGGVFNTDQLALFDVVIWNNVTGRTLTTKQRTTFKKYMESGGGFVGLHGAGDFSHHWKWYEDSLIGASFSHHTMHPQLQTAAIQRLCDSDYTACASLPERLLLREEWYVFNDNPRNNKCQVLYALDGNSINPNGNFLFLARNKDWGMGSDHPIIWKRCLGSGRAFYSALGHDENSFRNVGYLEILASGIEWAAMKGTYCK